MTSLNPYTSRIFDKLTELKQWQSEQHEKLIKHQETQREILSSEQQKRFELYGIGNIGEFLSNFDSPPPYVQSPVTVKQFECKTEDINLPGVSALPVSESEEEILIKDLVKDQRSSSPFITDDKARTPIDLDSSETCPKIFMDSLETNPKQFLDKDIDFQFVYGQESYLQKFIDSKETIPKQHMDEETNSKESMDAEEYPIHEIMDAENSKKPKFNFLKRGEGLVRYKMRPDDIWRRNHKRSVSSSGRENQTVRKAQVPPRKSLPPPSRVVKGSSLAPHRKTFKELPPFTKKNPSVRKENAQSNTASDLESKGIMKTRNSEFKKNVSKAPAKPKLEHKKVEFKPLVESRKIPDTPVQMDDGRVLVPRSSPPPSLHLLPAAKTNQLSWGAMLAKPTPAPPPPDSIEAKRKIELKDLQLFEKLEQLVADSSFCSTSSKINKFVEGGYLSSMQTTPNDTPQKHNPHAFASNPSHNALPDLSSIPAIENARALLEKLSLLRFSDPNTIKPLAPPKELNFLNADNIQDFMDLLDPNRPDYSLGQDVQPAEPPRRDAPSTQEPIIQDAQSREPTRRDILAKQESTKSKEAEREPNIVSIPSRAIIERQVQSYVAQSQTAGKEEESESSSGSGLEFESGESEEEDEEVEIEKKSLIPVPHEKQVHFNVQEQPQAKAPAPPPNIARPQFADCEAWSESGDEGGTLDLSSDTSVHEEEMRPTIEEDSTLQSVQQNSSNTSEVDQEMKVINYSVLRARLHQLYKEIESQLHDKDVLANQIVQMEQEKQRLAAAVAEANEEKKRLVRDRKALGGVTKKRREMDREQVDTLKNQVLTLQREFKEKEARWAAAQARQRAQVHQLAEENKELAWQLKQLKVNQAQQAKKVHFAPPRATRSINKINEEISKIPKGSLMPSVKPSIINRPASALSRRSILEPVHSRSHSAPPPIDHHQENLSKPPRTSLPTSIKSVSDLDATMVAYNELFSQEDGTSSELETPRTISKAYNEMFHEKKQDLSKDVSTVCLSEDETLVKSFPEAEKVAAPHTASRFREMNVQSAGVVERLAKDGVDRSEPPRSDSMPCRSQRYEDGSQQLWFSSGNTIKISADGSTRRVVFFNGDVQETLAREGVVRYFYAETKAWHETHSDGTQTIQFPDGQKEVVRPCGQREVLFADSSVLRQMSDGSHEAEVSGGAKLVVNSDGKSTLILPSGVREVRTKEFTRLEYPDGTVRTRYPDGLMETRYINGRVRVKDSTGKLIVDTHNPNLSTNQQAATQVFR